MRRNLIIAILIVLVGYGIIANYETSNLPNGWSLTDKMDHGRSEIAATVLDGDIFVAGGIGNFRVLKSCEKFNLEAQAWSGCPDLPRRMHHIGIASDGQAVYAGGGYEGLGFNHLIDPPLWKLNEDGWREVSRLPITVGEHALIGHEGQIYLLGGRTPERDSDQLWQFDPDDGSWQKLANMPTPRHSFAWVILEGELWMLGGRSAALGTDIDIVEIYNFTEDSWRAGPNMPTGRGGHHAAVVGSNIHVLGGEVFDPLTLLGDHEVLDTVTGQWTTEPPMVLPRHGGIALTIDDEIWLIGGGARPALHTIYSASRKVQRFRPAED